MRKHPRDILGVSIQSSEEEIYKRYKSLMLKYHPDKVKYFFDEQDQEAAKREGEAMQWAYTLLTNPVKLKEFEDRSFALSKFQPDELKRLKQLFFGGSQKLKTEQPYFFKKIQGVEVDRDEYKEIEFTRDEIAALKTILSESGEHELSAKLLDSENGLLKTIDLSHAIEYLRYDDDGNLIGPKPRASDRYRKKFDSQVAEFREKLPQKAPSIDTFFQGLSDIRATEYFVFGSASPQNFKTVYEFIAHKNSLAPQLKDDLQVTAPQIQNDYAVILNVFKHFFNGVYFGQGLINLKSDIQTLQAGDLDTTIRTLLSALSDIIHADAINPALHYDAINQLYRIMYIAIDSSKEAIVLMADRGFQQYVRMVQDSYLRLQNPQHLTEKWLSQFQSDKPDYLLKQQSESQIRAQLDKEFAAAFKEEDIPASDEARGKKSEAIIEQACKQVDMSMVTFSAKESDPHEEDIGQVIEPVPHKKAKVAPIIDKLKSHHHMRVARIGKANEYLLSAIAFQTNARLERDPARIAAGENVALDLYRSAISEVRKASSITRLYIYYQVLSGVLAFQYQGEMVDSFIETSCKEFNLISQFMPFVSMPMSHNDLDKLMKIDEKWLYKVLDHISTDESYTIEERTKASYLLFEGAYTGLFPEEHFDELRLRSIDTYLQSKGLSIANISEYVHPANSVLKRSPTGFVNPSDELNIPDVAGGRIIADIKGFKMNINTGELEFQLAYWQEGMPRSWRLMTEFEFYDMLQYQLENLNKAWFTLDPPDSLLPHLPLQEAISNLPDIPLRQTMLDADYAALKFFTTSSVSGVAPFNFQNTAEMIAHLPPHLIDVLMTKQANAAGYFYNSTDPSRYWYKTGDVERDIVSENGSVVCRIGQAPLLMAHQKMVIDIHGNMVDDLAKDELDIIIDKALLYPHELEKLITYVVDLTEKSNLNDLLEELNQKNSLLEEVTHKLNIIKRSVEEDPTIQKRDKAKAILSRSTEILQEVAHIKAERAHIQNQLRPQLKQALDLNKVFARRFTEHMDEIAQYIPIIGRMQLFVKLIAMKDAFLKIRADYGSNSQMMQQLDLLKINQIKPPESTKKVYVPAAIRKDVEGGLICFGGVSLAIDYIGIKYRIENAISKVALKKFEESLPSVVFNCTAQDLNRARWSLSQYDRHMTIMDRVYAEQKIWNIQRDLDNQNFWSRVKQSHVSCFQTSPFYTPFNVVPEPLFGMPTQAQSSSSSSVSFSTPRYTYWPTETCAASPYAPPHIPQPSASHSMPAPPPYKQEPTKVTPSFLLPPHFDTDPYAQMRLNAYQDHVMAWQSELPAYQAASSILSQVPRKERALFDTLQTQASHLIQEAQQVVAPVVNKFKQAVNALLDPISTMLTPQSMATFSATVVAVANMPESHPSLATPDYQLAKETVRQYPTFYEFAKKHLQSALDSPADILVPGVFLKTAEAFKLGFDTLTDVKTLDALGIPPYPLNHHPANNPGASDPMSTMLTLQCPNDLRNLPDHFQDSLLYVVNQDHQLYLHPYLLDADHAICGPDAKTFYLNPKSKAIESVLATGVVDLQKRDLELGLSLIRISEKYKDAPNMEALVADVFANHGFGNVSNIFAREPVLVLANPANINNAPPEGNNNNNAGNGDNGDGNHNDDDANDQKPLALSDTKENKQLPEPMNFDVMNICLSIYPPDRRETLRQIFMNHIYGLHVIQPAVGAVNHPIVEQINDPVFQPNAFNQMMDLRANRRALIEASDVTRSLAIARAEFTLSKISYQQEMSDVTVACEVKRLREEIYSQKLLAKQRQDEREQQELSFLPNNMNLLLRAVSDKAHNIKQSVIGIRQAVGDMIDFTKSVVQLHSDAAVVALGQHPDIKLIASVFGAYTKNTTCMNESSTLSRNICQFVKDNPDFYQHAVERMRSRGNHIITSIKSVGQFFSDVTIIDAASKGLEVSADLYDPAVQRMQSRADIINQAVMHYVTASEGEKVRMNSRFVTNFLGPIFVGKGIKNLVSGGANFFNRSGKTPTFNYVITKNGERLISSNDSPHFKVIIVDSHSGQVVIRPHRGPVDLSTIVGTGEVSAVMKQNQPSIIFQEKYGQLGPIIEHQPKPLAIERPKPFNSPDDVAPITKTHTDRNIGLLHREDEIVELFDEVMNHFNPDDPIHVKRAVDFLELEHHKQLPVEMYTNSDEAIPHYKRVTFELDKNTKHPRVNYTVLEDFGQVLQDSFTFEEKKWLTPQGKKAIAAFSTIKTSNDYFMVYLELIEANNAAINSETKTSGALLHIMGHVKELARASGAKKLLLQVGEGSNPRLVELLNKRYLPRGQMPVMHVAKPHVNKKLMEKYAIFFEQLEAGMFDVDTVEILLDPLVQPKLSKLSVDAEENLKRFGIGDKPPTFDYRTDSEFSVAIKNELFIPEEQLFTSAEQLASLPGIGSHIFSYVITEEGKLLLYPLEYQSLEKFKLPKPFVPKNISGDFVEVISIERISQGKPLIAAGRVNVIFLDGEVFLEDIDDFCPVYRCYGKYLQTVIEHTFNKNGFDATKKYHPDLDEPEIDFSGLADESDPEARFERLMQTLAIREQLEEIGLPHEKIARHISFIPPEGYTPNVPLPRALDGGYVDNFGNVWVKHDLEIGYAKTFEWKVRLSPQGKDYFKRFNLDLAIEDDQEEYIFSDKGLLKK